MIGAYALTHEAVDEGLTRTSPGNYALGYVVDQTFIVFYVGRSDGDLRRELHAWVGAPSRFERYWSGARAGWGIRPHAVLPLGAPLLSRIGSCADPSYTHFAFSYAASPEDAFEKERRNYDDFGRATGLDNQSRPVPPRDHHGAG